MKKNSLLIVAFVLVAFLASGCAGIQGGQLRLTEKADAVTVQTLVKNWQDYEVYYAGLHAGHPSAVMFDPKGGDRVILTERWFKMKDKELLDDVIDSIQRQLSFAGYYPRLWKVIGPDGDLYGYMFTSWDHASMRLTGEKTLFVNDLPMPPYIAIGPGLGFRTP